MEDISGIMKNSRRFYDENVADLIHSEFREYEDRIAAGIAGEGSDCFGYDDAISRDHDFGTGVCLWVTDDDMALFGHDLSMAYNKLVDSVDRTYYTQRLRERRGVMTIHDFYSNILGIDCDVSRCEMSEEQWYELDHSCLKTATNGQVFRDDLGVFTEFRELLLGYYPERVWRIRIAEQLHEYASALQVNYARCMTRNDTVAAGLCRAQGVRSAMELYFLLRKTYPPYYKWTYRALTELDNEGHFSGKIQELSDTYINRLAWEGTAYHPNRPNYKDRIVSLADELACEIAFEMYSMGLVKNYNPYLESFVDDVLQG